MTNFSHRCSNCGMANSQKAIFCVQCGQQLYTSALAPANNTIDTHLAPQTLLKQRYYIINQLGKGGMGTVYKALDTQLGDRPVAVKEMSQEGLSSQRLADATEAFRREAYILAHLQHAHLPSIYEFFFEQNHWYLIMSFIDGETLEHYLHASKKGYLPIDEVLAIGIQLCSVFEYLHAQPSPIIFRDLKLSNIMYTFSGNVYLIDFGIARHFKAGQVKDTLVFGSRGYAAPEQYGRAQTSPQSDIYSLGVILHQLLTGDEPGTSGNLFYFASLNRPGRSYPLELEVLLQQMLEIEPGNRPVSMTVVKQKLLAIEEHLRKMQSATLKTPRLPLPSLQPLSPMGTVLLTFNRHSDQITTIAWSPTSNRIASGSIDKTVQVWDADTGGSILTYNGHAQGVASLAWSANGLYIASGDFERIIHIWNATTGQQLLTYEGHNRLWSGGDAVRSLAWSPDCTRIASVSGDNTVQVWDTRTGNLLLTYHGHGDEFPVRCTAWSPNGGRIASSARYCDVWDATSGYPLYSNRSGQVHALTWSPDSSHIAISISNLFGNQEATIQVCDILSATTLTIYKGHDRPAYALAWSHNGRYIASADNDVHVWNATTGKHIYTYCGHKGHISSLSWSLDDTRIASAGVDATVQVWQIATQTVVVAQSI